MCRFRFLLLAMGLFGLSACAPVALTRTPRPTPSGEVTATASYSYPFELTYLGLESPAPTLRELFLPSAGFMPAANWLDGRWAFGVSASTELNVMLSFGPVPGGRVGGKTLLADGPVRLAVDYGAYATLGNGGVDTGLLFSVPLDRVELYSGVRGFGSYSFMPSVNSTFAGALTLGGAIDVSDPELAWIDRVYLELTLLAAGYNGVIPAASVQPVGFSLVPAIAISDSWVF